MSKYKYTTSGGQKRAEHRRIMEDALGRTLDYNEVVHHIDGNTRNNNIHNLEVISRSEHAKIHTAEIDRSRAVIQLDSSGNVVKVWPSAREASRNVEGAAYQNICKCCKGSRKTAGGYAWEYVE